MDEETSHLMAERLKKLEELKKSVEPYAYRYDLTHCARDIIEKYQQGLRSEEKTADITSIAGRVVSMRRMGKATFLHIQDFSGRIQLYFRDGETKNYALIKLLDIGDIIGARGGVFKTRTGEVSIYVESFELLTKSLRPLPEKFHGLKDIEQRYRQRYIDLIVNQKARETFVKRIKFIKRMRKYLESKGFLEVETPVLETVPGGADAEPFVTHHNTLDTDFFLRISLELHHKRLLVGGFERIYEFGKVFRNEGMSREHLQEFTLLEFYWAYADYNDLMKFVEDFYITVMKDIFGSEKINFQEKELDFTPPWPRIDYTNIVMEKTGINLDEHPTKESLIKAIEERGLRLEIDKTIGRGRIIDQLYKAYVRPHLVQPCFLVDHPIDISPLVKKHRKKVGKVERFQVVVAGSEVGNGYSELNDPIDQKERLIAQQKLRDEGDKEAQMIDHDFINSLEIGMPPAAGFGVGIDRLFMILADCESIRDTVFFPIMRRE
ncbi:MAG: lysine--tRNA ligase [Candidatus Woesearchaeota archaeon]